MLDESMTAGRTDRDRPISARPMAAFIAEAFIALAGRDLWAARLAELGRAAQNGRHAGRAMLERHAVEFAIQRLRRAAQPASEAESRVLALAWEAVTLARALPPAGQERLAARLASCLSGTATLVPLFHLLRTAALQRARGFSVAFAGLAEAAPYDLLISRDGQAAELVCDTVSAEAGRDVHRAAWFRLMDRIDPELQTWLAAHPGRYLLKMTLPQGLRAAPDGPDPLAALHVRISALLAQQTRSDHDAAAVLRLDPLDPFLLASQADELRLMPRLRREFGPEAHLAVTSAGGGVCVLAARAGREDEVAAAVRRRMAMVAPARLTGRLPGILAMLIDDTDRTEWRGLRERLDLEGEARQFLTTEQARAVVAVTCASRLELFGIGAPDGVEEGELRFRNPAHPAARMAALAPSVASTV